MIPQNCTECEFEESNFLVGPVRRESIRGPVHNWYKSGRLIRPGQQSQQSSKIQIKVKDEDDFDEDDFVDDILNMVGCLRAKWCFDIATHTWRYLHYPHRLCASKDCAYCSRGKIIGKSMGASLRKDKYNMVRDEHCDTVLKTRSVNVNVTRKKLVDPCPICLEPIRKNNTLTRRCGHTFCKTCINDWFTKSLSWSTNTFACPICRQK